MRLHSKFALSSGLLLVAASSASAQIIALSLEGDTVAGVGNITMYDNIAIGSGGDWFAEVRTDNSNAATNKVVLKNGQVYWREGQMMPGGGGTTALKFDSLVVNGNGNSAHNVELGNAGANNKAVYWNQTMLKRLGDDATPAGFSPTTTYLDFQEVRINDQEQVAVLCMVDDPTIAGTPDVAIVLWDTDGNGNITGESILIKEGDITFTVAGAALDGIGSSAHTWAFNNSASIMFGLVMATGSGATNEAIQYDQLAVAEKAQPSPVAGRNWSNLASPEMGLNSAGDYVFNAGLDGAGTDNDVIIKNNVPFVREGDTLPDMNGFALSNFFSGPVEIADSGDVLWYCGWDDPDTTKNKGLWINHTLVVQAGVSTYGSSVIKSIAGLIDGYHMDTLGQWIVFEGTLDDGRDGMFQTTVGASGQPGTPMCFGDGLGTQQCPCGNTGAAGQGCLNSSGVGGTLGAFGSPSLAAANLSFLCTGLPANKTTLLVSNSTQGAGSFGDGIMCIGAGWTYHGVVFSNSGGDANWGTSQIANQTWLSGQDAYFQAFFREVGGPCGATYNSTGAYKVSFIP